jgi:hypothetical protein
LICQANLLQGRRRNLRKTQIEGAVAKFAFSYLFDQICIWIDFCFGDFDAVIFGENYFIVGKLAGVNYGVNTIAADQNVIARSTGQAIVTTSVDLTLLATKFLSA